MNDKSEIVEKNKKAGNPLFIAIIFVALILFIFVVPDIYERYNKDLAKIFGIGSNNEVVTPKSTKLQDATSSYYQIGSNSTLSFNEITISDVSLVDSVLSFTVETEDSIDLDEADYYIEFYESRKTFISRRALTGYIVKSAKVSIDVNALNINTSTYFQISHIEDSSIPKREYPTDESGIATITCSKDNLSYTYDFDLDELIKVVRKETYTNTDLNRYSEKLFETQKKVKDYNEYNGVTCSIAENSPTFIYTLELDYSSIASYKKIEEKYVFEKGIRDNVIEFKMEAEGFDCK